MKKPSNKQLIVLLDAHAIIHRAYHAMPDFMTRDGRPTGAIYGFGMMVLKIIDEFQPDHIVACYDLPGPTFRHESFADYKGGRSKTDEALKMQFNPTRDICEAFSIPIYDAPGFEADDVLGTIATQLKGNKDVNILIASGDMDTLQLVDKKRVQVYTLKRGLNDTIIYDQKAVEDRFGFKPLSIVDYKAFRGDPSDNIPGIKGIGDKAATLAISKYGTIEKVYADLEKGDEGLLATGMTSRMVGLIKEGQEEAEFSKVIATIRHDAPIEFKIPEHSWKDAVDIDRAIEIFETYELRALPGKLRSSLGMSTLVKEPTAEEQTTLSDEDLKQTALQLWLIDSDQTNADLEAIKEHSGEKNATTAQKSIAEEIKKDEEVNKVYEHIEKPLTLVIENMQENGILVDQKFFTKLSADYHKELDKLVKKIHKFAGSEFNIKSPKQLSNILFEDMDLPTKGIKKSKTGSYSTNVATLEKLHGEHEIIQLIMEYRELEKLLSTYIDNIPDMVADDGRLHAEFLQNGTVTGRFSSRNPNMQNIPTRTDLGRKIREGFIAEKGTQLVSLDYSQIELRCLAMLSEDPVLTKIFTDGQDIHSAVASMIGGVPIDKVDRELRRKAKIVNFGILYGMGVNSLRKQMGGERVEAQTFHDGFFTQFPKATAYLEATKDHARKTGFTQTLFGRKRQFKNINSKLGFIRAMAERMALNAPIQGTSADMIKLAMVQINEWLEQESKKIDAKLILQIHDEIIYEVKDSFVEAFSKKADEIMKGALRNSYLKYESPVPLIAHYSAGKHWGELK
ncbi:MAG: DNA polymerase-1 [Candidatus Paceibacteria bacterium]|jgi:DNA polymerase-1